METAPGLHRKAGGRELGLEHPLGIQRASVHLKKVRMAGARRSPAQQLVGWHVHRWTATRIRIGEILKRHPEFIGRQVIEELGPEYSVRLQWVWNVMRQYRRASSRHSRKQSR